MSDRLGGKSVVYFGLYDPAEVPGVHKKVTGVLAAAEAAGFTTRWHAEAFSKLAPVQRLADAIDAAPESVIILRSLGGAMVFLFPALMRARRRGCAIVVDVPSPNRVAVQEIWRSRQSLWRRVRGVALFYLSGSWALWPATRIVQYAPESWWYRLGNGTKTVEIGNGIDVSSVEPRSSAPAWPAPVLRVIAVASVARWHGYDRLVRAIRAFADRRDRPFDVHLTIVGDGPALDPIKQLAASLGLGDRVTFAGTVTGVALSDLYAASHLAVSSIGLHRIGLSSASVLKAREYCAIGIPFIAAGSDPDFPGGLPFRLVVSGSEETADVVAAFDAFAQGAGAMDGAAMRQYAFDHLDWRHKAPAFGVGA